jgi:hypothetical protein
METKVTVEFKDHDKVILTDEVGNTYTSKSEELMDFLHGVSKISFNFPVSGSVLSQEEMREPIENALYATNRLLTTQATDLAEGIIQYIKDAGYTIVRTER